MLTCCGPFRVSGLTCPAFDQQEYLTLLPLRMGIKQNTAWWEVCGEVCGLLRFPTAPGCPLTSGTDTCTAPTALPTGHRPFSLLSILHLTSSLSADLPDLPSQHPQGCPACCPNHPPETWIIAGASFGLPALTLSPACRECSVYIVN